MDLHHLQLFVKVAATGSFSRAATLTGLTQSAVSKRMAELERECRWRLFERTGRGVALTEAGRWLLPRAESLAAQMSGLAENLASAFVTPQGLVRFAVQPSVAWPLMGRLYSRLKRAYPGIHLHVLEGPTGDIETWIREGRADLGLINRRVTHDVENARYLFSTVFHLISAHGDTVTAKPTIAFRALQRLPMIGAVMPNGGRVLIEEAAQRTRTSLTMAIEVNSVHLMKSLVAAGHGYGVTSLDSVATDVGEGTLQASRIVSPRIEEHFSLVSSPTHHSSIAVRTVAAIAVEISRTIATRR